MAYRSMMHCVRDLEKHGHLVRIPTEVDPDLVMAEMHKRVHQAGGPALFFERVKGSPFPAVTNIYGTKERTEFLFRRSLPKVKKVVELKADFSRLLKNPLRYASAPFTALSALPMQVPRSLAPIMHGRCQVSDLPQVKSWPMDGGAFVTLPQVFTLGPGERSMMKSNLGMYRIQLSGNDYQQNKEIGLHYQLHRGIGVHHAAYNQSDEPFRVSIFVGGPPSHAFAAIMPMPEGLSELTFAGMLAGRRFRYLRDQGHVLSADADFVITGTVRKGVTMPEGPFGDHLGYYSLAHDFPVLDVEQVYHRKDAVWHFTVVGRPPQEDSNFGYLIHKLVKDLAVVEFPGLKQIHAVDVAGVHPLLLAVGSERYMPFRERRPEEILTQANHLLGKGQTTLAKYLIIAAEGDAPNLDAHDMPAFFSHVLERIHLDRDLHFYTQTTMDTLDYSGDGWNAGSKLVMACCGAPVRKLSAALPTDFSMPAAFSAPRFVQPGILAIQGSAFSNYEKAQEEMQELVAQFAIYDMQQIPLVVICDDSTFLSAHFDNFLWATFTRSNPSHDIYGQQAKVAYKHWQCQAPLIIDARMKPHNAPVLVDDPKAKAAADVHFQKGGALEKWG